ncbi:MAG: carbamoyl phosphate synthase small subunit [Firmicutes bacterium]|nr:carbamoyl phosphate synthase small subunit [Bacillota bacterium]
MKEKAYLILQDGTVFSGQAIGRRGESVGELIFTTAMGGYMESLTDPSYFGQIIIQTFPLIGNYGAIEKDNESKKSWVFGYVVKELCEDGSNFRKEGELNDYLVGQDIVGISGIDTRELTRRIRGAGVMNAMISTNLSGMEAKLKKIKAFKIVDAVETISPKEVEEFCPQDLDIPQTLQNIQFADGNAEEIVRPKTVVVWNFGSKKSIIGELLKRGCKVISVPYNYTAKQIMDLKPDGIVLSNGAGDPALNHGVIKEVAEILKNDIPIFGICLGHQLIALSCGCKTTKLKYGHRGVNHPIKDLDSGRVYATSQNHGYSVVPKSVDKNVLRINQIHSLDKSVEGLEFVGRPIFSVQYHPEAGAGPLDTKYLFDKFVRSVKD